MKAHVVLVVLCVLSASMLALAVGAADQQLRTGGESVVGIDYGDERATPEVTDTPAGTTPTPSPTSEPADDGSAEDSTDSSDGDVDAGGAEDSTSTPTPAPTTDGPDESTPTATATTDTATPDSTPRAATATEADDGTDTDTDPGPDEQAGFAIPELGTGLWLVVGITVVLVLATVAPRRL